MPRLRSLLLTSLVLAPVAGASESVPAEATPAAVVQVPAPAPATDVLTVVVLPFESNPAARDVAPAVSALVASRLSESPRLRVLSGRELDAVPGAERQHVYMLTGRVDRLGERYVVTTRLVDSMGGQNLAQPGAECANTDALLQGIGTVAEHHLAALVPAAPDEGLAGSFVVGLRINNSFISQLASLNPGGDIELGYGFHPEWLAFLQVGLSFVRSNQPDRVGHLNVLPSVVGLRHYHRVNEALRPYWGLGLGVQLSFGEFGILQSTGPLPTVNGFFGVEYLIARRVGVQLEAGTNVAQAVLGLAGHGLGDGINLDLNAGLSYHF